MSLREDFQPLIDWVTRPSDGLQVAGATLTTYLRGAEGQGDAYWDGSLTYWSMMPRHLGLEAHEFWGAVFSGVLDNHNHGFSDAHVSLTVADNGAWLSVQGGPSGLGKQWLEGRPVERGFPYDPIITGEKPEDFHAWMHFFASDRVRVFNLGLTPRYLPFVVPPIHVP